MAGSGAGWPSACSTGCCATWPTCGAGPRAAGRSRGSRSSTPRRSSASRCGGRAATTPPNACWGASAWRWWTLRATGWPSVAVVPASTQDRDTLPALDVGKAAWPSLRLAIRDGAFAAERCQEWSNLHGMRHQGVERDPDQKGFVVLAGRWVVERSFGWLTPWGGLLRDRAGRLDVAAGRIACAAVLASTEAPINPV